MQQERDKDRTCDRCGFCCFALEIEEIEKPFLKWCTAFRTGRGCTVYESRPESCRTFKCLWLMSQDREPAERMPVELRPDNSRVMFGPWSTEHKNHLFVHCHPHYPDAWKKPAIADRIRGFVQKGGSVTVVVGKKRFLHNPGMPVIETTEAELQALLDRKGARDG